jgi:hypothetical protein
MKLRRGQTRNNLLFWGYSRGKERWVDTETFEKLKSRAKERSREFHQKNPDYSRCASALARSRNPEKARAASKRSRLKKPDEYREKAREASRQFRKNNPEKARSRVNLWRKNNPDKAAESSKKTYLKYAEKRKRNAKIYRDKNAKVIARKNNIYHKQRRTVDPLFYLACSFRVRLGNALRKGGFKKIKSSVTLLGCSWSEFKTHIEKQFQDGMTWDNRGKFGWHIDHIKPLATATTLNEIKSLCHYANLQPLWAKDNLSKAAKYNTTNTNLLRK